MPKFLFWFVFVKLEGRARSHHTPGEPALVPTYNRSQVQTRQGPTLTTHPKMGSLPLPWVLHTWIIVSLERRTGYWRSDHNDNSSCGVCLKLRGKEQSRDSVVISGDFE